MPTERFYNLSEAKKQVILDAIEEEFTRVAFDKVSINQIIQRAGISRGSFYTYFKDRDDILGYLFERGYERFQKGWLGLAEENGRDLWKTAEAVLLYAMENMKENSLQIIKNIVVSNKILGAPHEKEGCKEPDELLKSMYGAVDTAGFKDTGLENFKILLPMIFFEIALSMGWFYHHREDKEKIRRSFREKMGVLRYGVCRQ